MAAYRLHPGNASAASKLTGADWRTAHRAWHKGFHWSRDKTHHTPIQELIEGEQRHTRQRLQEDAAAAEKARAQAEQRNTEEAARLHAQAQAAQAEAVKDDVTQNRVQEAQMIRLARGSATAILVTLTQLAQGVTKVGGRVRRALETMGEEELGPDGKPKPVTAQEAAQLTRLVGNLTQALDKANNAAQKAMEMERLLLGEPQAIVGHQHLLDITPEEAERRITAAAKALERYRAEATADAAAVPVGGDAGGEPEGGAVH